MIPKRHIILSLILIVTLNLTFTVAYATSYTHVETWSFIITNNWNNVETWSFTLNAPLGWHFVESWLFSLNGVREWSFVESWSFSLSGVSDWSLIESWNFQLTAVSWNNTDTWNKSIGQPLSIVRPILIIVAFIFALLMAVIYAKKKQRKQNK